MTSITLHEGDNRDHLRRLIDQGVRVHAVVTDPPYGLVSVTKRFGADAAAPAKFGTDGAFSRASAGFMGSKWDGTGIERDPEFWRLIHDILLPGGYVVAFASSRTFARMAVAIEDAGFITHPMLGWVFGSGFPKAHNASKAIDKLLGCERPVIGIDERYVGMSERAKRGMGSDQQDAGNCSGWVGDPSQITGPGSPEAAQWEGWAYGAQALKPALEPIYVGQRPFDGKTGAPSIIKHGVGALNIDGCRVPGEVDGPGSTPPSSVEGQRNSMAGSMDRIAYDGTKGRHPANLLHDGSDDVVALFPNSGGSGAARTLVRGERGVSGWGMNGSGADTAPLRDAGTGSAARFFHAFPPDEPYPVFYHPKAGKADRAGSKHPTVKPIALMRWLCRLITPPGGTVLDPFGGSGTTAEAARQEGFASILMEAEPQFAADIRSRFGLTPPIAAANDDFDLNAILDGAAVEPDVADFNMLLG